jgi:MYXO-CTERM domain-containing protein
MKHFDLSQLLRASVLALCVGVLASGMTAYAQSNSNTASTNANTTRTVVREDDGTDWGWIGLLGLAGLAGLMPRKRAVEVHDREPNRATNR